MKIKDKNKIVLEYIRGITPQELAQKYNVARTTILYYLHKEPLFYLWKKKHWCARHKEFVELLWLGKSPKEIRNKLGISKMIFSRNCKYAVKNNCVPELVCKYSKWSKRTRAIYRELQKGKTIREIASLLSLPVTTVNLYVWRLKKNNIIK